MGQFPSPSMGQQPEAVALTPTESDWAEREPSRRQEEAARGRGDIPDMHPCCHTEGTEKLALQAWTCPRQRQHIPAATRIPPCPHTFLAFFSSRGEDSAKRASLPSCLCPLGHVCCLGDSHLIFVPGGASWLSTCDFCCFLCCCCFLLVKC